MRVRLAGRLTHVGLALGTMSAFSENRCKQKGGLLLCDDRKDYVSKVSDHNQSLTIFPQGVDTSRSAGKKDMPNGSGAGSTPCEAYNSLWNRLQWAERRNRCCDQSGCVFLGRSITGTCTPVDASIRTKGNSSDSAVGQEIDEIGFTVAERKRASSQEGANAIVKLYVEIANEKSTEPIKILLRNSISESAVESLRGSQQLANELSKKMILNYLNNPDSVRITSAFISTLMSNSGVRQSILPHVSSIVNSVHSRRYIFQYAFATKDYYLHPFGAGCNTCLVSLVHLLDWWALEEYTRTHIVAPLAVWALQLEGSVMIPAAVLAASALPATQESTSRALTDLAVNFLESDNTK